MTTTATTTLSHSDTDNKIDESTLSKEGSSPTITIKKRRLSRKDQKLLAKQKKRKKEQSAIVDDVTQSKDELTSSNVATKTTPKRHEDFLEHYTPIPFDNHTTNTNNSLPSSTSSSTTSTKVSSLGKWFPKAIQLKRNISTSTNGNETLQNHRKAAILLFYQYINPLWSQHKLQQVQDYLIRIGQHRVNIAGRIRIANEGLNVTLSAIDDTDGAIDALTTLHYFAQDLHVIDDAFRTETDFKYITDLTSDRHFHSYHIIPVQELVYYGFNNNCGSTTTSTNAEGVGTKSITSNGGAKHVPPEIFHRLLAGEDIAIDNDLTNNTVTASATREESTTTVTPSKKKDIVVIDVRNHYEAVLGRFDGQEVATDSAKMDNTDNAHVDTPNASTGTKSVAKYIDPKMRKSTDFPLWVQKNAPELIKKDRILLYCTGGIRCERASEHLSLVLHNELNQYKEKKTSCIGDSSKNDSTTQNMKDQPPEIYQLQGGIEKYLQAFKDTGGGFWRGKNFTFDKREAISVDNMNGDGGILKVNDKKLKQINNKKRIVESDMSELNVNFIPECKCVLCNIHWDRYIGKKKCCTCGVPILVCDRCCSTKKEEIRTSAKCPICIEEQITIPVAAVAYTNNGKDSKVIVGSDVEISALINDCITVPKASSTVLKWGGGHGFNSTKQKRQCKFGSDCHRSDCVFDHP